MFGVCCVEMWRFSLEMSNVCALSLALQSGLFSIFFFEFFVGGSPTKWEKLKAEKGCGEKGNLTLMLFYYIDLYSIKPIPAYHKVIYLY